jgi:hypothetical protein
MKRIGGIPSPLSWKATKLTTYPSGGANSRWSDGDTLHSSWVRLALGREDRYGPTPPAFSPSPRNEPTCPREGSGSCPPWSSETACDGGRGRSDGGGGGRLKGEQGERGQKRKWPVGGTRDPGPHTYTPMEGQWVGEKVRARVRRSLRNRRTTPPTTAPFSLPLLKRRAPIGSEGDPRTDILRQMGNGLRARYKPRGIESWPSTRVRQLSSSNRVRDNWGHAHTRPRLEPLSRGIPRRIRG